MEPTAPPRGRSPGDIPGDRSGSARVAEFQQPNTLMEPSNFLRNAFTVAERRREPARECCVRKLRPDCVSHRRRQPRRGGAAAGRFFWNLFLADAFRDQSSSFPYPSELLPIGPRSPLARASSFACVALSTPARSSAPLQRQPKGKNVAFAIKQLIPVPIKRAVKKLLGLEKPKPAAVPRAKPVRPASAGGPAATKTSPGGSGAKGTGAKRKGSTKRRGGAAKS